MSEHAVVATGLHKRYGDTRALDGLDLEVPTGTVYGVLGPNGAGKTTTVRALATLVRLDAGSAEVAGYDVARQPELVRSRIGFTGQYAAVDEILTGRDNLTMFGRLYHLGAATARRRADELLEQFSLTDAANRPVGKYSGGMRRRLDLAASLIQAPAVLFLDEPTAGLDPRSRNEVWETVRTLVAAGTTVLLTSQYLDEVDHLAGRIAVVDAGQVVAEGTSAQLKSTTGGDRLEGVLRDTADLPQAAAIVARACGTDVRTDEETRHLSAPVTDRVQALADSVRALHDAGLEVEDIGLRRPTLDEAFLHLTGLRPAGRSGTPAPESPESPDTSEVKA